MKYKNLVSPLTIRGMTMSSRAVLPGMDTKMEENAGYVSQQLIDYHVARAAGGCGLNIIEAISVHAPTAPFNFMKICGDEFLPGLTKLTNAVHAVGGKIAVQLWQGGLIPTNFDPSCPAFFPDPIQAGREVSVDEIHEVERSFGEAAARAVKAGFDAIEFHCGHCYSPHAFLSPGLNKRTDEYGGSEENCMRFPLECLREIRANIPEDMPLFIRVSVVDDFLEGGYDLDYMIRFLKKAKALGVDVADCSRGNWMTEAVDYEVPSVDFERGFNVPNAKRIKEETDLIVMAVGRINDPDLAESILAEGKADLVAVGRGQIADPDFIRKCEEDRVEDLVRCIGCNQGCYDAMLDFSRPCITCLQNPAVSHEALFAEKLAKKVDDPKKVLVIGGGIGGMQAAELLKARGHEPILCEMSDHLGGQFLLAGVAPSKHEFREATEQRADRVRRQGVDIRLNTKVDAEMIDALMPDAAIIAIGAEPIFPNIPGLDKSVTAFDVLEGKAQLHGDVVVIGGGLVGVETAEYAASLPKVNSVTIVEMLNEVGSEIGSSRKNGLERRNKALGIKLKTRQKCMEIGDTEVRIQNKKQIETVLPCSVAVNALGSRPRSTKELTEALEHRGIPYQIIGDAVERRFALNATAEAAAAAFNI